MNSIEKQYQKLLAGEISDTQVIPLIEYLQERKLAKYDTDEFEYYREWLGEAVNIGLKKNYQELFKKYSPFRDLYQDIKNKIQCN